VGGPGHDGPKGTQTMNQLIFLVIIGGLLFILSLLMLFRTPRKTEAAGEATETLLKIVSLPGLEFKHSRVLFDETDYRSIASEPRFKAIAEQLRRDRRRMPRRLRGCGIAWGAFPAIAGGFSPGSRRINSRNWKATGGTSTPRAPPYRWDWESQQGFARRPRGQVPRPGTCRRSRSAPAL
jgi:hypothetical protein